MKSLLRAAFVAVLIGLVAVTPLSAVMSPGYFELRLPRGSHTVELVDHTGLVRGLRLLPDSFVDAWEDGVANPGTDPSELLVVTWSGGCGVNRTYLTFDPSADGYVLHERTSERGCSLLMLWGWRVGIVLWRPIDASTVRFVSLD